MNEPTLQQLRYAVAVADQLNFGRAAHACFVSQPALSNQIRELEAKLGVQLFERSTRRVTVTPEGEPVIQRARGILTGVDELVEAARHGAEPLAGPLRLGVIPTVAPYLLPDAVRAIRRSHPRLELYLREDQTARLVTGLVEGRLDLLVLALPVGEAGITTEELYAEPFVVAVPSGHALARRRRVRLDDLSEQRLVLLEEGHCLRDQALEVCDLAGVRGAVEIQGTSLGTVVQMVEGGMGATLLPATAVPAEVHSDGDVEVRRLTDPAPGRTIGLAWRSTSPRAEGYRELGRLIGAVGRDAVRDALAAVTTRA